MWAFSLILDLFVLTTNQNWIQPTYLRKLKINWNRAKNVGLSCVILSLHLVPNFSFFLPFVKNYIHILDEYDPLHQCWSFQASWMGIMISERVKRRWRSKVETNSVQWLILNPRTSCVPQYSKKKSAVLARNVNSPMISKNSWKANRKTSDHTVSCLRPMGNVPMDWPVDMAASIYRRTSKILSIKNSMRKNLKWAAKQCLFPRPIFFQDQGVLLLCCQ